MKIINESYYAVKMTKYLSKLEGIASARKICEENNIPFIFALRILCKLVEDEILESFRGVKGGFRLKKNEVSYYEIIKVIQPDFGTLKELENFKDENELVLSFEEAQYNLNNKLKEMKIKKI